MRGHNFGRLLKKVLDFFLSGRASVERLHQGYVRTIATFKSDRRAVGQTI